MAYQFIYTDNHVVTLGDISIIPNEYIVYALQQKNDTILCTELGWFCPVVVVGIGKTIQYSMADVHEVVGE
jgi:hypothetical protein